MAHQAANIEHKIPSTYGISTLLEFASHHSHWALRLSLAGVFLYHGIGKFMMLESFSEMMGLPIIVALLVALVESVGGVMVIVGAKMADWVTRVGAAMFIPVMLGAIFMVHWGQWNFVASETHPMGGMEFQVTLLLVSLYMLIKGNKA